MSDDAIFRPGLLDGHAALITGGGSGIGLAIARELGGLGARVVIAARDAERLEAAAEGLRAAGIDATAHAVNIRDEAEVAALFDAIADSHGLPDLLVNNAGGQFAADALDISANGFRAVVDLNLNGTWHMSSAYARRAVEAGRAGRIVNIVLVTAGPKPGNAHGAAARAGIIHLTKTLAFEWARHGIAVNAIAPGTIETEGLDQYNPADIDAAIRRLPIKRFGTPREVALMVAYLASPAGDFITGTTLDVDGGAHLVGPAREA
jgi:NAD(P)-dependent dehydrogenase (short-subunit alcohol dehydrogenase family)